MLHIEGLHRRFGDVVALDGVSFDVPSGRLVGFVGRGGAGKTTMMRVVMGVTRADRGEVRWDGIPVDTGTRLRFGYMPEERGLYPRMKVRDQLRFFGRLSGLDRAAADRSAEESLARLGLQGRADAAVGELSPGDQQRVQLGVALVHEPELLVLDEPFSWLDPAGTRVVAAALVDEVARGAAVLVSSHRRDMIEGLSDDIVVIDAGRIVAEADPALGENDGRDVEVEVMGARTGWADHLPGVLVVDRCRDRLVLHVASLGAVDDVLMAARAAGQITMLRVGSRAVDHLRASDR